MTQEDRQVARNLSESFRKDLAGREHRRGTGKGEGSIARAFTQYRKDLVPIAQTTFHTTSYKAQLGYVSQLIGHGGLTQLVKSTEKGEFSWQATAAVEICGGWRSQINLQKSILEDLVEQKGEKKYEGQCKQLILVLQRLQLKVTEALAEYIGENPPRSPLSEDDIEAVATVLHSVEHLLMCIGDLYLL